MPAVRDVTIIVPTFNRAEYLGECLASLIGQSVSARQIIVVDDGSTDDTRAVVDRYGAGITYLHQPNAGKSAALNRALGIAIGHAVWIFDDDDVADPQALDRLWRALEAQPEAGFAFGGYDNFSVDEAGVRTTTIPRHTRMDLDDPRLDPGDLHMRLLINNFIFQPAMLVRRDAYDAVGPFDTDLPRSQDYDMLLRLSRRFAAARVGAVLFHQRQHDGARGPAALRIAASVIWQRQARFDAMVIEKQRRVSPLADYLPFADRQEPLPPAPRHRALVRRAAAAARRQLWDPAFADLRDAAGQPADPAQSRETLQLFQRALNRWNFADDGPLASFVQRAEALPESRLRRDLRKVAARTLLRRALQHARRGNAARSVALFARYLRATLMA